MSQRKKLKPNYILESRRSRSPAREDPSKWQEKASTTQDIFMSTLTNSILTDVTLEVGSEKTLFHAHKRVLAFGSPVFEAMFYGCPADNGGKIIIPDIDPKGFKLLLRHLYGDIIKLEYDEETFYIWVAADKYCVKKLKYKCEKYFRERYLTSSNIWFRKEVSKFLNVAQIVSECRIFLEIFTESAVRNKSFLEASFESVKDFLAMSTANVSEQILLDRVIDWGIHQADKGKAVSPTVILKPLLPYIRFRALSVPEYKEFLSRVDTLPDKAGLLEEEDAHAIMLHLMHPSNYSLPDWCCKEQRRRQ